MEIKNLGITQKSIQLFNDTNEIVSSNGILIEGDGLCAIYDNQEETFKYVCTNRIELDTILETNFLQLKIIKEDETRNCNECGKPMLEGFYFESDGTQYCSETCLVKVISWDDYLAIHDDGNGDAYWTDWYDE